MSATKYHAKRTEYGGQWYPSKLEAEYARGLDLRKVAGDIVDWDRAEPILLVPGKTKRESVTYVPDFWVKPPGIGGGYYVEVKGAQTAVWRLKRKLLKFRYPALKLLVVYGDGREEWV